jgi:hypothetical protein
MGCCPFSRTADAVDVTIDKTIASFCSSCSSDKLSWKLVRHLTWYSDSILFTVSKAGLSVCGAIVRVKNANVSHKIPSTRDLAVVSVRLNKAWFAEQATTTVNGSLQEVVKLANQVLSSRVHASIQHAQRRQSF